MRRLLFKAVITAAVVVGPHQAAVAAPHASERLGAAPVVVLADVGDPNGGFQPAFLTAFAVYDDGTIIRRAGPDLVRVCLPKRIRRDIASYLDLTSLVQLESSSATIRLQSTHEYDHGPDRTRLHLWLNGRHHMIELVGISSDDLQHAVSRDTELAGLPSPVRRLLSRLLQLPVSAPHRMCHLAECFALDLHLPGQHMWVGP